jgi:CMP-N,N'-diacetyllegionaminic acid synthase
VDEKFFQLIILVLIPARSGSKGVQGKNTKLLGGIPLINYTIQSALASDGLMEVLVSTDDTHIQKIAIEAGAEVPFLRPAHLAQDDTPTLPVIQHALHWLAAQGRHYDAVCLLQPTNPFRPAGFIDRAINQFLQSGADTLISVLPVPLEFNPHWVFEPDADGLLKIATGETIIIPRRQALPKAFYRDGSIYLTKTEVLLSKNALLGESITYIEADSKFHVNIDTHEDWEVAENLLKLMNANR